MKLRYVLAIAAGMALAHIASAIDDTYRRGRSEWNSLHARLRSRAREKT